MIARTIADDAKDIWGALSAPLPPEAIQWRQDGRPLNRDGRYLARFVAYVDAHFVHERFDSVVPGEWDSHLEPLPNAVTFDGEDEREPYAFKCRIQVLGVIREDVGTGKDYKSAASDAFKRAAVRFGIAKELYSYGPNFVPMDGDGKYAKPIEDPGVVYRRKRGMPQPDTKPVADGQRDYGVPERETGERASGTDEISHSADAARTTDEVACPKCGGRTFDNRATKRNPKAPDYRCRDRNCDGVVWPPRPTRQQPAEEREEIPF